MRTRSAICSFVIFFASFSSAFAHHMAVVVNRDNPLANVSSTQLVKLLRTDTKKWSDGKNVVLILHKDSAGETETLQRLNKMSPAEWRAFLTVHRDSIMFVDSDAEVIKMVQSEPGAIGLIDVRSIDNTVNVVRVDGKLPMEFGYLPH
jgi:ABC-type phosphate transport system substrate-binding protein